MDDKRDKIIVIALWIVFAVVIYLLQRAIYMHFDDFGYASLSYGYTDNTNGMSWNILDFLNFIKWHYLNWGGRILYYGIFVLITKCGEFCLQIFQAIILVSITFLTFMIIRNKCHDYFAGIISIVLFCSIGIMASVDGVFWYSASAGYVWPFLAFFVLIYILKKSETGNSNKKIVLTCVLAFIAGFSHEQVAVGLVVFLLTYGATLLIRHERVLYLLPTIISGCTGAAVEVLAPGNFHRSVDSMEFYSMSFVQKIYRNVPSVLEINFEKSQIAWIVIWAIALLVIVPKLVVSKKIQCVLLCVDVFCAVGVIVSACFEMTIMIDVVVRSVFIVISLAEFVLYLINKRNYLLLSVLIGAFSTQAMLLIVPDISSRLSIPFALLFHICVGYALNDYIKGNSLYLVTSIFMIIVPISIINFSTLMIGFYQNKKVNDINRSRLEEKSCLIKAGAEMDHIILYKLKDDAYCSMMPYQHDFISYWIKNYFEIPQEIDFIWNNLYTKNLYYEKVCTKGIIIDTIWPKEVDAEFSRTEDGGIDFSVTPVEMNEDLRICVDGKEVFSTIGNSYISGHLEEEKCIGDVEIKLKNIRTGDESGSVYLHFD